MRDFTYVDDPVEGGHRSWCSLPRPRPAERGSPGSRDDYAPGVSHIGNNQPVSSCVI